VTGFSERCGAIMTAVYSSEMASIYSKWFFCQGFYVKSPVFSSANSRLMTLYHLNQWLTL
jgi:hypothetical protein